MSKFVNPRVQRMNLIRYIGDKMEEYGGVIPQLGADGDVANQGLGPIQSSSRVRLAAPWAKALSLANTCSIGLRSGL